MSYWAEIDENNYVVRVLVGDDTSSDSGESFMNSLGGNWIQTSEDGSFRFNFAGIGYMYDPIDDAFIAPMPECGHDELLLNIDKKWECANEEHFKRFS